MSTRCFAPGITSLVENHPNWIAGHRVGLATHTAAVDSTGIPSVVLIRNNTKAKLTCLFGPEHGFFGASGAGSKISSSRHPVWNIPIRSLYGAHRKPTPEMLRNVDFLVVDFQDLAVRCYTYLATLLNILEAAAEHKIPVVVCDRPIPLPTTVDGPFANHNLISFVAPLANLPLCYGMTPGETALWIRDSLKLPVNLRIARMQCYHRETIRGIGWPPWIPPSPGIRSWESAACYPVTVGFEALPGVDHGRRSLLPFQVVGASWIKTEALLEAITGANLPGIAFHSHAYFKDPADTTPVKGIRMTITNQERFRPMLTFVTLLHTISVLHGDQRLWNAPDARPAFFDQLMGTPDVRTALRDRCTPQAIARSWHASQKTFLATRDKCLLYPKL